MAFENVFRGIDFGAPGRAAERQQSQFLNMLSNTIAQKQALEARKEDRAFKERQLDAETEAQQAKANQLNVKDAAEGYIVEQLAAEKNIPIEQAAAELYSHNKAGQPKYNNIGEIVGNYTSPLSLLKSHGGMSPLPDSNFVPVDAAMAEGIISAAPMGPPALPQEAMAGAAPMGLDNQVPQIQAIGPLGNTTLGKQELIKANVKLQEYAAKQGIDLANLDPRQQAELNFERKKAEQEAQVKIEASRPQAEANIVSTINEAADVNQLIDDLYKRANYFTTGFIGENLSGMPGMPAHDFAADLKVLESDAGLSKLIEVKERGGTFGALQEKELDLLINSRAALLQSQSPQAFKKNLIRYKKIRNRVIPILQKAYEEKYKEKLDLSPTVKQMTPEQRRKRIEELEAIANAN